MMLKSCFFFGAAAHQTFQISKFRNDVVRALVDVEVSMPQAITARTANLEGEMNFAEVVIHLL